MRQSLDSSTPDGSEEQQQRVARDSCGIDDKTLFLFAMLFCTLLFTEFFLSSHTEQLSFRRKCDDRDFCRGVTRYQTTMRWE
jgi:hypothetical protein